MSKQISKPTLLKKKLVAYNTAKPEHTIMHKKIQIVNNACKLLNLVESNKTRTPPLNSHQAITFLTPRIHTSPYQAFSTPIDKIKSSRFDSKYTDSSKFKSGSTFFGTVLSPSMDHEEVTHLVETINKQDEQLQTMKAELEKIAQNKDKYKEKCVRNELKLAKVYNVLTTLKVETEGLHKTVEKACTIIDNKKQEKEEIKLEKSHLLQKLRRLTVKQENQRNFVKFPDHQRNKTVAVLSQTLKNTGIEKKKFSVFENLTNLKERLKKVLKNTEKRISSLSKRAGENVENRRIPV